jgi:DNA-binding NtrC family response regulator
VTRPHEKQNPICILTIDDQLADRISTRVECERIFQNHEGGLIIEESPSVDEAIKRMTTRIFQIILLDKDLGRDENGQPISGINYIRLLQEMQPVSKIIMLTASEKPSEISLALRNGAYDYIIKGADEDKASQREASLRRALLSSWDGLDLTVSRLVSQHDGAYSNFICSSPAMIRFDQKIKAVADSQHPALLLGPTGIGKGAIARRINDFRSKNHTGRRPFVNINIGAMPDSLAQAELFGQDPYSFTGGGSKTKTGLIDVAKNGDIFLDEVGDTSEEMQLRLLKVVEEKEFIRVGGRTPIKTNARFIFATNKDLKVLVAQKKFREDLYMRIAALELEVPSLEERKEDLPEIIEAMCTRIRTERPEKKVFYKNFPDDFIKYLTRDDIPGNIRGIQNAIERFVTFAQYDKQGFPDYKSWKNIIGVTDNPRKKVRDGRLRLSDFESMETDLLGDGFKSYREVQKLFDKKLIEEAIARFGSLTTAAEHLKVSKGTLSLKMKALKMRTQKEGPAHVRN